MRNSSVLFCLLVLYCVVSAFRFSSWVRVSLELGGNDLDGKASVLLPAQAMQTVSSEARKQFSAKESTGMYAVTVYNIMAYDGIHDKRRKEIYEEIIRTTVESVHGKLYDCSAVLISGYNGVDYIVKEDSGYTSQLLYVRCVISEHTVYILQFIPADGVQHGKPQRKSFFDSLIVR
jgi:hypothetical protein